VRGEADSDRSLIRIRVRALLLSVLCRLYCRWFGFERCERVDAAADRCDGEREWEAEVSGEGRGDGEGEWPASESVLDWGSVDSVDGFSLC